MKRRRSKIKSAAVTSWKTTVFGIMAATGYSVERYVYRSYPLPHWVLDLCGIMFFVGLVGLCVFSRDHDKSSEHAGLNDQ